MQETSFVYSGRWMKYLDVYGRDELALFYIFSFNVLNLKWMDKTMGTPSNLGIEFVCVG
jgi:hypothetical protein